MSLKIEIDVPYEMVSNDHAGSYLNRALSAIGFVRAEQPLHTPVPGGNTGNGEQLTGEGTSTSAVSNLSTETADNAPKRERGKPAAGKSRRTAEEVAEDKAADEADAARAAAGAETGAEVADRQISTGGERVDPDNPEDAAAAEQDAADEAAETEANKAASGKTLTADDVRTALGAYVAKHGMDAAQADGPRMLADICGPEVKKISDVPEAKLAEVVALVEKATAAGQRYGGLDL